ncbi:NAD(P)H-dependent flavin oxidoreductase [Fructilactobacillus carniphilus]|uniref:Probable nitronate monooxygenase n=1 Tax=Fructilactobacillus carniphilus TaxID=2940297 RepID=A0ABY5BWU7_9LACO|nr:nitronate monooxygenase [Fructilactobacillus carniphilus]USS90716.1 nitronate monooxygenase [Fructilactobacillus carniphilus]
MQNRVTEILGTRYPLIQAPMNWLTDARLVAAVTNAGGLGTFGPNAGRDSLKQNGMEIMEHQIKMAQELTNGPIAMTLGLNPQGEDQSYAQQVLERSLALGIRYFLVGGEPDETIYHEVKAADATLIARSYNPTPAEAQRQVELGADLIVATGYDEGGVIPTHGNGTFTTVPRIADAVSIPVLAAGGINDDRGVRAAMSLGAEGVFVGSRFLVTQEARTAPVTKQKIMASTAEDLLLVAPNKRSLRNRLMEELATQFREGDHTTFRKTLELGGVRPAMLHGELEAGEVTVNTGLDLIQTEPTVAELINELMQDFH